jgi:N-carbamoylputrescine amidase
MRIALVQQHATVRKEENLKRGLAALEEAAGRGAELVCYAELAFEPFYPQRPAGSNVVSLAEPVPGPITEVFCRSAAELGVVIVINLYERDGEKAYDAAAVYHATP